MAVIMLTAAALIAYALYCLASPSTRCGACNSTGTKGRRRRTCRHCGGTGTRFRPGAPLLFRGLGSYRRHRASGTLTPPPIRKTRNPS